MRTLSLPSTLSFALLFGCMSCMATTALVGCGGRTQGEFDFTDGLDGSIDASDDVTVEDVSTDASVDSRVRDGAIDAIGVDVTRIDSGRIDAAPDGILVDVIGVDGLSTDTGTGFDSVSDVVEIDVVEIDSGVDGDIDTGIEGGFDTGVDGGPIDGGIHCGAGAACDPTTEECCASFGGAFSCVTKGTCGGIPLSCSSAASCPTGDVCCFTFPGPGGGGGATCEPACAGVQLCATTAECPPGTRCRRAFGGYRTCR